MPSPPPTRDEIAAGHDDADDFEFIELVNIADTTVDLSQVRFVQTTVEGDVEGIRFDFAASNLTRLEPGQHVLVVEDIIDSGLTIAYLLDYLKELKPASLKVCTLIEKTERQKVKVQLDYVGHIVTSGFLVGYGLDLNERSRALPEIYHLKT